MKANQPFQGPEEEWACPKCHQENPVATLVCEVCQRPRDPDAPPRSHVAPGQIRHRLPSREKETDWVLEASRQAFMGAQALPGGLVLFQTWAPNASKVFLAGTFNDWDQQHAEFELAKHPEPDFQGYFFGVFGDVPEDSEYKYVIHTPNGEVLWRNDPRACFLVHHGAHITNSLFYNPLSFEFSSFTAPSWKEMVLYEMHIGTFTKEGTYRSCMEQFSHLKQLGVNTLAVMPLNEDYHERCWGYDPISLYAIHPPFGGPRDLQEFVEKAHQEGFAVVLDWIPNHMCGRNILRNFDVRKSSHGGPYFYPDERSETEFGPKLNYSSVPVRRYLRGSVWMFLTAFNFDGIRVDSTITMRSQAQAPNGQNIDAWTLMQEINDMVHQKLPGKIMIAEDLQGDHRINYALAGYDSQWDPRLFSTLFVNAKDPSDQGRNLQQILDAICYRPHHSFHSRIIYIENHDTIPDDRQKRFPEAIIPGAGDSNLFAVKRTALCLALLLVSPGIPMLLQGQEILDTSCPIWPEPPKMDWERKDRFPGFFRLHQDLIAFRKNQFGSTKGLTAAGTAITHMHDALKLAVLHRFDMGGPGDDVIVVFNFSNAILQEYEIGFPRPGTWKVRFNSDAKLYWPHFEDVGLTEVETRPNPYDGFFFSGTIAIGRYSLLILSMDSI